VPLSLLIQSSRRFGHVFWRLGACTRRHLILRQPFLLGSVGGGGGNVPAGRLFSGVKERIAVQYIAIEDQR
jgi:hypothetical protein